MHNICAIHRHTQRPTAHPVNNVIAAGIPRRLVRRSIGTRRQLRTPAGTHGGVLDGSLWPKCKRGARNSFFNSTGRDFAVSQNAPASRNGLVFGLDSAASGAGATADNFSQYLGLTGA